MVEKPIEDRVRAPSVPVTAMQRMSVDQKVSSFAWITDDAKIFYGCMTLKSRSFYRTLDVSKNRLVGISLVGLTFFMV